MQGEAERDVISRHGFFEQHWHLYRLGYGSCGGFGKRADRIGMY